MPSALTASPECGGGIAQLRHRLDRAVRWRGWPAYRAGALVAGAGFLVLTILLMATGLVVTHALAQSVGSWDEHINAIFARHRTSLGNRVTGDFTLLADSPGVIAVAALVSLIAVVRRRTRLAVLLLLGLAVELSVFLATGYVVARPRPRVAHLGSTPSTFSWPSGHVAATFVLYGGIALIVAIVTRRPVPRILSWTVAAGLTACVGLSRIYRGDHHPNDAIAGLVLGVGALCVGALAVRAWRVRAAQTAPGRRPELTEAVLPAEMVEPERTASPGKISDEIVGVA